MSDRQMTRAFAVSVVTVAMYTATVPNIASATPLTLDFHTETINNVWNPIEVALDHFFVEDVPVLGLEFCGGCPEIFGTFALVSHGLQNVTYFDDASGAPLRTNYLYEPATLRMDLEWHLPGGTLGHGTFTASVKDFGFSVNELPGLGGGDIFNEIYELSDGIFDPALAAYLGIRESALGGGFTLTLDGLREPPRDALRYAYFNNGMGLQVVAASVPEPSMMLLAGCAAAGVLFRRRLGRRRHVAKKPTQGPIR